MPENQTTQATADSRSALTRLLLVLVATMGFMIYSYGWTVTDVDLTLPQEARRQENLTIALRDLLSPRIFQQDREVVRLSAPILIGCETGESPPQSTPSGEEAAVMLEPACGDAGDIIAVQVAHSTGGADARIRWVPSADSSEEANERPREVLETGREDFVLAANGSFTGTIEIPRIRGGKGQLHEVNVLVAVPSGPIHFSDIAKTVIGKMGETIFMALIATTVAIPIAALISFFAARNLMRSVYLSTGTIYIYFLAFVAGIKLGTVLASAIFGNETIVMILNIVRFALPALFILQWIIRQPNRPTQSPAKSKHADANPSTQIQGILMSTLVITTLIAAFAGIAYYGGNALNTVGNGMQVEDSASLVQDTSHIIGVLIAAVGNFLLILSTLLGLFKIGIAAIISGFMLAGMASALLSPTVRRITGSTGMILGIIMGAASGGILMILMAKLGLWAALLGFLPPLVGAILGGQSLRLLVNAFRHKPQHKVIVITQSEKLLNSIIFWVGAIGAFILVFSRLNIGRALVDGTLPPQNTALLFGMTLPLTQYVFEAFLMGAVFGGVAGALTGVQAAFPLGSVLYNFSRTALNTVRSIEPLIMGLVFVIWVGIGPFAGVLALTLHSIAALGKLYSEQIENIDPGPIEALQSTGANRLQTIVYAVVPQIVPPYIAFTMYRWDINVRMSTIIGFVGGGGIGLLLQQQINLLRYRDAGVAVLAIAVVVSILDYLSAIIRERLT